MAGRGAGARGSLGARFGRGGDRELARRPEGDDVVEAGDQAGQGVQNEGVQGRDQPGLGGVVSGVRADTGQQGGGLAGQR